MNETDLAWAAGFIDGEGTIYISPENLPKHPMGLRLLASQTVEAPLHKLQSMFGGNVYLRHDTRKEAYRPLWTWQLGGALAKQALKAMLPYLTVKHRQAAIALNFPIRPRGGANPERHPLAILLQDECRKAVLKANAGVPA
jgi:hypothetical protein